MFLRPGSPPYLHRVRENQLQLRKDWKNPDLKKEFPIYTHSFEPLIRSVEVMRPGFNMFATEGVSIVSNAGNLRRLFDLFHNHHVVMERYEVEWKRGTLFISKWFDDPALKSSQGYGRSFEKAQCWHEPDDHEYVIESTSHHRVVRYTFAGVHCIVQSEVDAYKCRHKHENMPVAPESNQGRQQGMPPTSFTTRRPSVETAFSRLSFSRPGTAQTSRPGSSRSMAFSFSSIPSYCSFTVLPMDDPGHSSNLSINVCDPAESRTLKIHHVGRNVPSECLVEVKTQSRDDPQPIQPEAQLYFSRRTQLYTAQHRNGVFGNDWARLKDKTEDLRRWEETHQRELKKVRAFLGVLWDRVRRLQDEGGAGLSLVTIGDGNGVNGTVEAWLYRGRDRNLLPERV